MPRLMRLPSPKGRTVTTSHLTTLDFIIAATPAALVLVASLIGLIVSIVADVRDSRTF